jgi:hypothetical protein
MFPVPPEQIERAPSECRSLPGPSIIEEPAAINDVLPPPLPWHVPRWAVGIEPRETLSPSARDSSAVFDKHDMFILIFGPAGTIRSKIVFIGGTGANASGDGTPIRHRLHKVPGHVNVQLRNRALRGALLRTFSVANSAVSVKSCR